MHAPSPPPSAAPGVSHLVVDRVLFNHNHRHQPPAPRHMHYWLTWLLGGRQKISHKRYRSLGIYNPYSAFIQFDSQSQLLKVNGLHFKTSWGLP